MAELFFAAIKCPRCGDDLPADSVAGLCPRCLMAEAMQPTHADQAISRKPTLTPTELAPHFPQLEIIAYIGRGGMGVVYKARQKALNRVVALKLLAPEREKDATFAERFEREAQALAALDHTHIVTVYDFGETGGFYYLLMEFVDGVNLRQAMKAGRFTPEQALAIVPPVCDALEYAHENHIVHRDIKPENLLLDKNGRVKIADFGIAKMLGADPGIGPAASQPAGTPKYMAPEQKEHQRTDHRADVYSLGVVLYEMLTGELPDDKLQPPSSRIRAGQFDPRLDEIVLRALRTEPELRYQTAADLKAHVETIADARSIEELSENMIIELSPESIRINGTKFTSCPTLQDFVKVLGSQPSETRAPDAKGDTTIFFWHELGIRASGQAQSIEGVIIRLTSGWSFGTTKLDSAPFPRRRFHGKIIGVGGASYWGTGGSWEQGRFKESLGLVRNDNIGSIYQSESPAICKREGKPCLVLRDDDSVFDGIPSHPLALVAFSFPPAEIPQGGVSYVNGRPLRVEFDESGISINGHNFIEQPTPAQLTSALGLTPELETKAIEADFGDFKSEVKYAKRHSWIWNDLGIAGHTITRSEEQRAERVEFIDFYLIQDLAPQIDLHDDRLMRANSWVFDGDSPQEMQFPGTKALFNGEMVAWGRAIDYATRLSTLEESKPGLRLHEHTENSLIGFERWLERATPKLHTYYSSLSSEWPGVGGTMVRFDPHSAGRIGSIRFWFAESSPSAVAEKIGFRRKKPEKIIAAWDGSSDYGETIHWVITNSGLWLKSFEQQLDFSLSDIRWVTVETRDGSRPPRHWSLKDHGDTTELVVALNGAQDQRIRINTGPCNSSVAGARILESRIAAPLARFRQGIALSLATVDPAPLAEIESAKPFRSSIAKVDLSAVERELVPSEDVWTKSAVACPTCGRKVSPLAKQCSVCDAPIPVQSRHSSFRLKVCSACGEPTSRFGKKCQRCGHPNTELKQQRLVAGFTAFVSFCWLIADILATGGKNFWLPLLALVTSLIWGGIWGSFASWYSYKDD